MLLIGNQRTISKVERTAAAGLEEKPQHPLPKPVKRFLDLAIILNAAGLLCEFVARSFSYANVPYSSPLLNEGWAADLTNYQRLFVSVHTPKFFEPVRGIMYQYPAPIALIYGFLLSFAHPVVVLEVTAFVLLGSAALVFARYLQAKGLAGGWSVLISCGALLLSYPAAMEMKQGNTEIFIWLLTAVGIFWLVRGKTQSAAVCIGIAGAMKLYPFVYLGLFLTRSRYRAIGTALIAAVIITLVSLFYLDPSITVAWHGVQNGLNVFEWDVMRVIRFQTGYDHSLFALIKVAHLYVTNKAVVRIETVHRFVLFSAVAGTALFFARIRHLPLANQVICLCIASIALPPVSYDYTLLNLYVPWAILVCFAVETQNVRVQGLTAAFVCFGIATSIETEVIYEGHSLGGQIKAIALCVLMGIALRYPFGESPVDCAAEPVTQS